jgi:H+-translocating diphosphatase
VGLLVAHIQGGVIGIATSYVIILVTQYYTDYAVLAPPHMFLICAARAGPKHSSSLDDRTRHEHHCRRNDLVHQLLTEQVSVGLESTALPIIAISVSLLSSYMIGARSGLPETSGGLFGTASATMGSVLSAFDLNLANVSPTSCPQALECSAQPCSFCP